MERWYQDINSSAWSRPRPVTHHTACFHLASIAGYSAYHCEDLRRSSWQPLPKRPPILQTTDRRDWQSSKDNHQIFVVLELRLSLTGSAQWQRFNETLELKCRPLPRLRHARNMISCVPALRYVCSERAQRSLSLWTFVLLTVARPVPCSKSCPHSVAATLGTRRRA